MRGTTFVVVCLFLATVVVLPAAAAEEKTQDTGYLPNTIAFTVWCSQEEHRLLPQGPPNTGHPVGWALSGEPECAFADALNKKREMEGKERMPWGFGSAVHSYTSEDEGSVATAIASDAVFGEDAGYLRLSAASAEGTVSTEGCGAQSIILPYEPHWQVYPPPPAHWWAFISEIGIDEDLTVCFATTGIIHGTWGA